MGQEAVATPYSQPINAVATPTEIAASRSVGLAMSRPQEARSAARRVCVLVILSGTQHGK